MLIPLVSALLPYATSVPHAAKTDRRYSGWTRAAGTATGLRGTLSLLDPGHGNSVSWLGFNTPTVGSTPPRSWIQLGLNANGHPYLEWANDGGKPVYLQADQAVNGPINVRLVKTPKGYNAYLGDTLWKTILLKAVLGQMYAGSEWLDDADSKWKVGNLNTYEGGKWKPFRGAKKVGQ